MEISWLLFSSLFLFVLPFSSNSTAPSTLFSYLPYCIVFVFLLIVTLLVLHILYVHLAYGRFTHWELFHTVVCRSNLMLLMMYLYHNWGSVIWCDLQIVPWNIVPVSYQAATWVTRVPQCKGSARGTGPVCSVCDCWEWAAESCARIWETLNSYHSGCRWGWQPYRISHDL